VHDQGKQQPFFSGLPQRNPDAIRIGTGTDKRIALLESTYACLWYYPDTRIIHHKFLQPISDDVFREVLTTGLSLLQEQGAEKWLSDDRNNSILSAEVSAWSQEYWLPRALEAGWKYWAMLPPIRTRAKLNVTRLVDFVSQSKGVITRLFTDPNAAREWLAQQGHGNKETGSR
jgi:hypothetical protein